MVACCCSSPLKTPDQPPPSPPAKEELLGETAPAPPPWSTHTARCWPLLGLIPPETPSPLPPSVPGGGKIVLPAAPAAPAASTCIAPGAIGAVQTLHPAFVNDTVSAPADTAITPSDTSTAMHAGTARLLSLPKDMRSPLSRGLLATQHPRAWRPATLSGSVYALPSAERQQMLRRHHRSARASDESQQTPPATAGMPVTSSDPPPRAPSATPRPRRAPRRHGRMRSSSDWACMRPDTHSPLL